MIKELQPCYQTVQAFAQNMFASRSRAPHTVKDSRSHPSSRTDRFEFAVAGDFGNTTEVPFRREINRWYYAFGHGSQFARTSEFFAAPYTALPNNWTNP